MTNENANPRARLVQAIRKASSLAEQQRLVEALDTYDANLRVQAAQDRAWDAAGAVADRTLSPVRVHEHHTAATDWMGEIDTAPQDNFHQAMVAEASLWYGKVSEAVKDDPEELAEQARGMARHTAGRYGEQAPAAAQTFLDYVAYLHGHTAASGLPQIDQVRDPKDNPSPTPYPPEVFDTFGPEIDQVNNGIEGTTDSDRAPLIQEIMSGGQGGAPEEPDEHSTSADFSHGYSEVPPGEPGKISTGLRSHGAYRPSVANSYLMNMDDFRAQQAEAQRRGRLDFKKKANAPEDPNGNGDDDSSPMLDTDGDYWQEQAQQRAQASMRKGAPFADYEDFDDCKRKNSDKDDADAYCGEVQRRAEGDSKESVRHTAPGGGEHAPYRLEQGDGGWYVVNDKGERKNDEPKSKSEAREFQKALYKNVPGARQSAEEDEQKKESIRHTSDRMPFTPEERRRIERSKDDQRRRENRETREMINRRPPSMEGNNPWPRSPAQQAQWEQGQADDAEEERKRREFNYDYRQQHPEEYNQPNRFADWGKVHEAASSLPTQHQIIDPNNNPTPQADQFNQDVMFPLNPNWVSSDQQNGEAQQQPQQGPQQRESTAAAKRRAYVASLLTRDPASLNDMERQEVRAYLSMTAGLHKQADMYSAPHSTPGYETPIANSADTTPHPGTGSFEQGQRDGQADAQAGERPTFSDASSHASPYVQGYSAGYAGQAPSQSSVGGAGPDVPYSMGGDAGQPQNFQQAQQDAQVARSASRRTAKDYSEKTRDEMADKGQARPDGSFPIKDKEDLKDAKNSIGRADDPEAAKKWVNQRAKALGEPGVGESDKKAAALTVSASLVSKQALGNADFRKGYGFGRNWKTGRRLVALGSPEFESGLYAGITDNPAAQRDWVRAHRKQAKKHPELMRRISEHQRATRKYARNHDDALVRGFYVQAATSTDLVTTGPGTSPDPMGSTPINGSGTQPPLEGQGPSNAPGGPSPYNGAPPYGQPVAPDPVMGTPMTPTVPSEISTAQMSGYGNPAANQGNPRAAAFRQRVQAALAQQGAA